MSSKHCATPQKPASVRGPPQKSSCVFAAQALAQGGGVVLASDAEPLAREAEAMAKTISDTRRAISERHQSLFRRDREIARQRHAAARTLELRIEEAETAKKAWADAVAEQHKARGDSHVLELQQANLK